MRVRDFLKYALAAGIFALEWARSVGGLEGLIARSKANAAALDRIVAERDWLAENQASFPPLRIGRFFVHGSHVTEQPPAGYLKIIHCAAR